MYFKKSLILLIFSVLSSFSFAQYGNEWIDYNQTYYKFKIGEEGIYRLTYQTLDSIGVPISSINPKNFQLFLNGEEQHIYLSGESDNTFDSTDFIEFYGKGNDGSLDKELYRSPEEHTNPYYSLYSDSSVYFLTWNNAITNNRILDYYDNNYTGKTSDSFFIFQSIYFNPISFYPGTPNNNDGGQHFSEYTDGEGFTESIWNTQKRYRINTPNVYKSGPKSNIEVLAFSSNNNKDVIVNNYNHEFGVSIKNKNNLIRSFKSLGHQKILINEIINNSDLEDISNVYLGETSFNGSGFQLSFFKIKYPRYFNLNNESNLSINSFLNSKYIKFINYPSFKTKPIIYDLSSNKRIRGDKKSSTEIHFNLSAAASMVNLVITDSSDIIVLKANELKKTKLVKPNSSTNSNYIIISNKSLSLGAEQYKEYRKSEEGGSYSVEIFYVDDIYNNFMFGQEHPLALKRFLKELGEKSTAAKYILLLGKGQLYSRIRNNSALREAYNLIPSIGVPASDVLFVSPLNTQDLKMSFVLSRIPARDNEQISSYLEKLKAYETSTNSDWKKKVIQLAGGASESENNLYKGYLSNYYNLIQDTSFGGYRNLYSKNDPIPVQTSLTQEIQNDLNNGAAMLSYFGHGAAQITEISLGEPSHLNNLGKTPLFLFNGCAIGNTYEDLSLGEQFLFEPQKGALGWIASTSFGFTSSLFAHTLEFHKKLLKDNYGEGIGIAMKEALTAYGNPNSPIDVMQARQFIYHGDPVLSIPTHKYPDFSPVSLEIESSNISVDSSFFELTIKNYGKASNQNLQYYLTLLKDGQIIFSDSSQLNSPYWTSVVNLGINKKYLDGLVTFQVIVDPENKITELALNGETNNILRFDFLFKSKAPKFIKPVINSIVPNNNPEILIQIENQRHLELNYVIEWDTTPHFSTPLGVKQISSSKNIISTEILLPLVNEKDYYLRCKSIAQNGEESEWTHTTFGVIENDSKGWTQGNKWKFNNLKKSFIDIDTMGGRFNFSRTFGEQYKVEPGGDDIGQYGMSRWIVVDGWPAMYGWWPANGVNLMVLNNNSGKRFMENSIYNQNLPKPWAPFPPGRPYTITGEKCGVYHYNTNDSNTQDSLAAFLNRIPEGFHLIMVNAYNCDVPNWKQDIWDQLEKFGISKLKQINKGEPFGVFATKNTSNAMPATEHLADYNSITPPSSQKSEHAILHEPFASKGHIESEVIGPVSAWQDFSLSFIELENSDSFTIEIIGSTDKSNWVTLLEESNKSKISLNTIDAKIYPYLRFKVTLFDDENRTSPIIKRWKINYIEVSEGLINYDLAYKFKSDTIQQGDDLVISLAFMNVSNEKYDSSDYVIYTRNNQNKIDTLTLKYFKSLNANEYITTYDTINTSGYDKSNGIYVVFNPSHKVQEINFNNNIFFKEFYVHRDLKNPILDVAFDGNKIIDHDIVSPNTLITISVMDENTFLHIDKEDYLDVILKHPNGKADTLTTAMNNVFFTPSTGPQTKAKLEYQAIELPSGNYELNVLAKDASGNLSSKNQLKNNFQVVSESAITNFYPYPNPFTTNTRFIYTLTGDKLPDHLKIQILTVTGKVIREITQEQLGEIKIGNNISEYAWDGTDEFGDKLANGVYLYRIVAKINNKDIMNRETSADHLFSNGYGKLYLMR